MMFNLPPPPQLGINVWARDIENKLVNGFVSGFMGDPTKGGYSIQITFFNSTQQYRYYSIKEKGKLWNEL
jgi:hypothetical protein